MSQFMIAVVAFLFLVSSFTFSPEGQAAPLTEPAPAVQAAADEKPVLLAQRKKRKKKRRKKKTEGDAAATGDGTTVHASHEGADAPYQYEVGLLSDFAIVSSKTGDAESGAGVYTLGARMLYIIAASFEVGGELEYSETTVKGDESEMLDRNYVLTLLGTYNFGNLDTDPMVFFVNFGFGFGSNTSSSEVGDVSTDSKGSITRLTLGLGLHYFVDSNVALTTQFAYDSDTIKVDGVDDPTTESTIHIAKIGFTLFI